MCFSGWRPSRYSAEKAGVQGSFECRSNGCPSICKIPQYSRWVFKCDRFSSKPLIKRYKSCLQLHSFDLQQEFLTSVLFYREPAEIREPSFSLVLCPNTMRSARFLFFDISSKTTGRHRRGFHARLQCSLDISVG